MPNSAEDHKDCCGHSSAVPMNCPECGRPGRPVTGVTLDRHLAATHRARLGKTAAFCANPSCKVVYFTGKEVVHSGETLLPVTLKDPGDNVHVCYCFGIKRSDIRRDLAARGATDIPDRIRRGIAEGGCECEIKNPQGVCCLGNVAVEIGEIREEVKSHG